MTFTLPNLPYSHDALAPHMSKETLEYHHDKHHQAYVTNGNNAIKGTEFEGKSLEEIVKGSFGKNPAVFNNAGQHYNHLHFWNWMKPNGGGSKLPGRLEKKINEDLGGFEKFKTDFAAAGVGQFGSGWCWLQVKGGKLEISKTPNGEKNIAELDLKVTQSGKHRGLLADTQEILRLNTVGGVAPAGSCTPGAIVGVPYRADYVFLQN